MNAARRTVMLALTAHGFGHAAQASPIVNRLRAQRPGIDLLVVTDIARSWLESWIDGPFELVPLATDPGIRMQGPLQVDAAATVAAYLDFDRESDALAARLRELILSQGVDLVLADVPWLPLRAAAETDVPGVALCSLNWVDILHGIAPHDNRLAPLLARMREAYEAARVFLQPAPAMPMPWLSRRQPIGHVSRTGSAQRERLREYLELAPGQHIAVLQFGGETGSAALHLPHRDDLLWLVAGRADIARDCLSANAVIDRLGMRFVDLVASIDLMLTKPGYSSFAEAATHGLPLLTVRRDDWPESPWLLDWARAHLPLREIDREQLARGDYAAELDWLLAAPRPAGLEPAGIPAAAAVLEGYL
jgi:hypothetical protein